MTRLVISQMKRHSLFFWDSKSLRRRSGTLFQTVFFWDSTSLRKSETLFQTASEKKTEVGGLSISGIDSMTMSASFQESLFFLEVEVLALGEVELFFGEGLLSESGTEMAL